MPFVIYALAASAFAIGTTEFVIVGLLPAIATDLHVSLPSAGLLISLYALAITLGTPIFSALTGRYARRGLMLSLMGVFTVTNLVAAIAPDYYTLLASRIVIAVSHGVFFGVGTAFAASMVPKEKSGSAVATMIGGLTIAMVIGVPLGSWIGQSFNWRVTFLVVTVMGATGLTLLAIFVPRNIPQPPATSFLAQMKLLGNRNLSLMYLLTAAAFGGTFAIFTFLAPILTEVTGVGEGTLSIALMIFGGATVLGNFAGGKLTDQIGTSKAMVTTLIGLIASFVLVALAMRIEAAMLVAIAFWGIFAFAIPPIMHNGVVKVAGKVAPEAVATASGMNVAAFNLGISGGSFVGGRVVEGWGLAATPYAAIAIAIVALGIATLVGKSQRRRSVESVAPASE
jgi:MFS transporter, DHA1 family, inner membrane transport protein